MASKFSDFQYTRTVTFDEWFRSEKYHNSFLLNKSQDATDMLEATLKHSADAGLPDICVSWAHGKFFNLLAKSIGAKRILEVGTLGGFSAIWFARALPDDGELVTLEYNAHHAKVAGENFKLAGVAHKITQFVGPAADSLSKIQAGEKPFDMVFIDADKVSNVIYFSEAKRLIRPGGIIIVDNAVYEGRVGNPDCSDDWTKGVRELLQYIKEDNGVEAITMSTLGERGWDGFTPSGSDLARAIWL